MLSAESYTIFCYSTRGGQIQGETNIVYRIRDYKPDHYFFHWGVSNLSPSYHQLQPTITNFDIQTAKKIFKGKKQSAKDYREMIYGFSPGLYRHWSFLPSTMQKKRIETSGLPLSDCNVTSKMPVQYHQRLWREYCNDIGNFTLHTILSDEVSCNFFMLLVSYWMS